MIYFILAFLIVLADQASKYLITLQYSMGGQLDIIPGILRITYVTNTGGAFSMFSDHTMLLAIISAIVCVVIIIMMITLRNSAMCKISLGFILGGAIGNLIDRFVMGYVVDMFEPLFIDFAVFNVADIFITIGALLFVISVIFFWPKKTVESEEGEETAEVPAAPVSRRVQRRANKYGPDIDEATIVIPTQEIKSAAEKLEETPEAPKKPAAEKAKVQEKVAPPVSFEETYDIPELTSFTKQVETAPAKKEVSANLSALPDDILNDLLSVTAKVTAVTAPVEISTSPADITEDLLEDMPELTYEPEAEEVQEEAEEIAAPEVSEVPAIEEAPAPAEEPAAEAPEAPAAPAETPAAPKKAVAVRVRKATPKAKPAETLDTTAEIHAALDELIKKYGDS